MPGKSLPTLHLSRAWVVTCTTQTCGTLPVVLPSYSSQHLTGMADFMEGGCSLSIMSWPQTGSEACCPHSSLQSVFSCLLSFPVSVRGRKEEKGVTERRVHISTRSWRKLEIISCCPRWASSRTPASHAQSRSPTASKTMWISFLLQKKKSVNNIHPHCSFML